MGIWNPQTETGAAHYAEYSELPAKKIWSWGADPDGPGLAHGTIRQRQRICRSAGRSVSQPGDVCVSRSRADHPLQRVLDAGSRDRRNFAREQGWSCSFRSHGSDVSAALNVNERDSGRANPLTQNGQTLWSETADLTPEKTWSHSVTPKDAAAKVTFELKDREGKLLLQHTDGKYDWDPESTIKVGPQQIYEHPRRRQQNRRRLAEAGHRSGAERQDSTGAETYEDGAEEISAQSHLANGGGKTGGIAAAL